MEQSRFEAFQQSTFSNTAVSNFIAACLIHANKRSARGRLNHIRLLGGEDGVGSSRTTNDLNDGEISNNEPSSYERQQQQQQQQYHMPPSERAAVEAHSILSSLHHQTLNEENNNNERPKLSDLVAPGTASKITAVVTTLAKINAQRLIQSARNLATNDYNYDSNQPILPQHLLEAHRRQGRNQSGKSGFFMDLSSSTSAGSVMLEESTATTLSSENMTVSSNEQNQMKYMAALQAQEEFDKAFYAQENEEGNDASSNTPEQKQDS